MKKQRICFLTDSIFSYGGVQRVTAVIAKEMAKEHEVTIVTFDKEECRDESFYGLGEVPICYRFISYPKVGWMSNMLHKAYSAFYKKVQPPSRWSSDLYAKSSFPAIRRKALLHVLLDGQFDIIIGVHAPLATRLATLRPQLKGVRCIGWIHNSFEALYGSNSLYIGEVLKRHYVYQLQKLDATIVLCQHDAELYQDYDPETKPVVIYNPLTLKPGKQSTGTSKRFLAVGRFSPQHKGFDLLIDAFHLFSQTNSEWMLDIVGEGPEEQIYRNKIAGHGLEERIHIHPFTNDIQGYYSNAQVFVLSSRWEGMPLVLMEAMSHGLPIISSNLPISLEIMGDFGLYFENGNVEHLAQRLNDATKLKWPIKSKEALAIAQRFNIEQIMEQWMRIICPQSP